jgi:protein subunit release factor B
MSSKKLPKLLDEQTKSVILASDEADAAFWDEFYLRETSRDAEDKLYTITIKDELTGEEQVIKHVKLGNLKSKVKF